MMPVYLLSLTLLITSVIKVTDVFLKGNQAIEKSTTDFVRKTKELHHNEKGNLTFGAVLMTLMVSAMLLFFAFKFKIELNELRYRKQSYLCFKYLNVETENYIKEMAKFNIALRSLYAATFTGYATAQAKAAHKATTIIRNTRHGLYLKNLVSNPYCSGKTDSLSYIKNLPFETNQAFLLQTNIDETIRSKGDSWTTTLYRNPIGIRFKKSFCLQGIFNMESAFFPNLKLETREISMEGFSKLKCLSGSP